MSAALVRSAFAGLASALLIAGSCLAQGQVYVVDAANGPGTDFLDLPPAVAAANAGDILVLRAGTYSAVTISEGIALLGGPGVRVGAVDARQQVGLRVVDLPAGQSFLASGLVVVADGGPLYQRPQIAVVRCAGAVHLERVSVRSEYPSQLVYGNALRIEQSPLVHVTDSSFLGAPAVLSEQSSLVLRDSECLGSAGFAGHGESPSGTGIVGNQSRVLASRCRIQGGDMGPVAPSFFTPGTAIQSSGSEWILLGDETTRIEAGNPGGTLGSSAVRGDGIVTYNPAVTIVAWGGSPPLASGIVEIRREIPSMSASGGALGGSVQLDLFGSAGQAYGLFVGLPGPRLALGTIGDLWFDPVLGPIPAGSGVLPATRHASSSVPVPRDPWLLGTRFAWQGLVFDPVEGLLLSNPANYVHD